MIPHGGRLTQARAMFPDAPAPFLDLSTGISPHPYPWPELPPAAFTRLPEPEDVAALEAAAAAAYGVADPAMVAAAPGTQALIQMLPRLFPATRVAVVGPTYAEHARAWAESGAEIVAGDASAPVRVLCNPNNPDGRRWSAETLLARDAGRLIVDEAFADFAPEGTSLAPYLPRPGVVVLRSFGKAYGLAGVRLGFALAAPVEAAAIRAALGPWAISGPAIAIGRAALADTAWRTAMHRRLESEATALDTCLAAAGLRVLGGTPLFRLAASDRADLPRQLARAGILVRGFPDRPGLIRFGLPGCDAALARLAAALRQ